MKQIYNHKPAFTIHDLAQISDWLGEQSELFIDIYSRNDYLHYFIRSIQDLRLLVMELKSWRDVCFNIYSEAPFPIRGIANKNLLERALQQFPEGKAFYIICYAYYPDDSYYLEDGNEQSLLINTLAEKWGHSIALGSLPDDEDLDNFDVVMVRSNPIDPSASRKKSPYAPYDADPARYQWIVDMWRE